MRGRQSVGQSLWTLAGSLDVILRAMGLPLYQLETHMLWKTRLTTA